MSIENIYPFRANVLKKGNFRPLGFSGVGVEPPTYICLLTSKTDKKNTTKKKQKYNKKRASGRTSETL